MQKSTMQCLLVLYIGLAVPLVAALMAPAFGQCGGRNYKADCPKEFRCQTVYPDYYHQCVPKYYQDLPGLITPIPGIGPPKQVHFDPVIGATSCQCYPRRNIETLQASYPAVFNMLILAVEALMSTPESLDISWFRLSGIHGAPKVAFQMDPNVSPSGTGYNTNMGYCTHSSNIFTTWHRPYLAFLEQHLYRIAVRIASQFSGPSYVTYSKAAEQVRLPYWDWARRAPFGAFPPILMTPMISVIKPGSGGVPIGMSIPNPLYQYNFQSLATISTYFPTSYHQWMSTVRRPPPSSPILVELGTTLGSRISGLYACFRLPTFNQFSHCLENNIHNPIHVIVGGRGHMSGVDVAGFDPSFWLHHANVDRITAMYQAAYPNRYLSPETARSTFARIVPGIDGWTDNLNTNLYPFRKSNGAWFKSDDLKTAASIWGLNYGYDEVPCNYGITALQSLARQQINALYAPIPDKKCFTSIGENVYIRDDFTIRVIVDRCEIPGSWTCYFFLGKPEVEANDFGNATNRIASLSSFGNPQERMESLIYDTEILISDVLYEQKIEYSKDYLTRYLSEKLEWRVVTEGTEVVEVPIEALKTLKIGVYVSTNSYTNPEKSDVVPENNTPTYLPEITKGKSGGISSQEEFLSLILLNGTKVEIGK